MIHDATVEVTCDGCGSSEFIELPAGLRDTYIARDSDIERKIQKKEWIVRDGKHYCSKGCAGI